MAIWSLWRFASGKKSADVCPAAYQEAERGIYLKLEESNHKEKEKNLSCSFIETESPGRAGELVLWPTDVSGLSERQPSGCDIRKRERDGSRSAEVWWRCSVFRPGGF